MPDQAAEVQQAAIAAIPPGISAKSVAEAANEVYREQGYETGYRTGRSTAASTSAAVSATQWWSPPGVADTTPSINH